MSLTQRVLIALIAGLGVGVAASVTDASAVATGVSVIEPVGALWVNAIRMTVVPLIVALLITGIASGSARSAGEVGGKSLALFVVLIGGTLVITMVAAPPLLSLFQFDTSALAPLDVPSGETELPAFRDWVVGLVPTNPVRAAADGAMLPLVVFSTLFGLAMTRLDATRRDPLLAFFQAVTHTMYVIVEWILAAAPIGVFALVVPLAARSGAALVGALGGFLIVACGLVTLMLLLLYPVSAWFGGIPIGRFARAAAPVQAVGFSTRSSLATLPALIDASERVLGLPPRVTGVSLPVAVAVFKFASPTARLVGTLFVAQLYNIDLGLGPFIAISLAIGALAFYSPGIPSGGLFVMTPIYVAFGLPIEGIGLLIALDLIPDMFITVANVTADMTVAAIVTRLEQTPDGDSAGLPPPFAPQPPEDQQVPE